MKPSYPRLAVVVPCFNESEVFTSSERQLRELLGRMEAEGLISEGSRIVYVDDGSKDNTWSLIEKATETYPDIDCGLKLGHNSGHQNALLAGMEATVADFDAIVTIDADLQDDIEAIPEMVREYLNGAEIVYGVRESRQTDTWFKRSTANIFYKLMSRMGAESIPNHADFRLMSSRAVEELLKYKETNIFLRGIVPRLGLNQSQVKYDRKQREAGETKYPFRKMMKFAVDGITSFSIRPVRMVFMLGVVFLIVAIGILIYTLCSYFSGHTIAGWTSLMLSIWFCSGILLLALGIIGEYVGKIFLEVKERPRYVIEKTCGLQSSLKTFRNNPYYIGSKDIYGNCK